MIKPGIKKMSFLLLTVIIVCASYLIYQNYHDNKVKALLRTVSVDSINVTISASGQNTDYYLTNKDEIQKILDLLAKSTWNYHSQKLGGGYNFSQTISCHLYSDTREPITINFLKHKLNIYVTAWGQQDYGAYTISQAEGQKIIDTLLDLANTVHP